MDLPSTLYVLNTWVSFVRRHVYSTKTFIIPVISFSILYNIPKFFELTVEEDHFHLDEDGRNVTMLKLKPTELRKNPIYIRVYILWMNIIFHILGPFVVLGILNYRVYTRIKKFEQTLRDTLRANTRGRLSSDKDEKEQNIRTTSARWLTADHGHNSYKFRSVQRLNSTNENVHREEVKMEQIEEGYDKERSKSLLSRIGRKRQKASEVPDSDLFENSFAKVEKSECPSERSCILLPREAPDQAKLNRKKSSFGSFIRSTSRRKKDQERTKRNSLTTPRKREVLLSRISIYIVFMFVICHR